MAEDTEQQVGANAVEAAVERLEKLTSVEMNASIGAVLTGDEDLGVARHRDTPPSEFAAGFYRRLRPAARECFREAVISLFEETIAGASARAQETDLSFFEELAQLSQALSLDEARDTAIGWIEGDRFESLPESVRFYLLQTAVEMRGRVHPDTWRAVIDQLGVRQVAGLAIVGLCETGVELIAPLICSLPPNEDTAHEIALALPAVVDRLHGEGGGRRFEILRESLAEAVPHLSPPVAEALVRGFEDEGAPMPVPASPRRPSLDQVRDSLYMLSRNGGQNLVGRRQPMGLAEVVHGPRENAA